MEKKDLWQWAHSAESESPKTSVCGLPDGSVGTESTRNEGDTGGAGSIPGVGKILWRRKEMVTHSIIPA